MNVWYRRVASLAGFGVLVAAGPLAAQDASVPTPEAKAFLGEWSAVVDGPDGPLRFRFDIVDDGGQTIGQVWDPGGSSKLIEEITMSGAELMLSYRMDLDGEGYRVVVQLAAEDEGLAMTLNVGGGMFMLRGRAVRR